MTHTHTQNNVAFLSNLQMNCFLSIAVCSIIYILMVSNSVLCKTQKVEKVAEVTEVSAAVTMKDTCETLPSTIQVTKEEYDDLGNVVRSCEGTIGVTKCEGSCNSQIQPSVVTPTGFLKVSFKILFNKYLQVTYFYCYSCYRYIFRNLLKSNSVVLWYLIIWYLLKFNVTLYSINDSKSYTISQNLLSYLTYHYYFLNTSNRILCLFSHIYQRYENRRPLAAYESLMIAVNCTCGSTRC